MPSLPSPSAGSRNCTDSGETGALLEGVTAAPPFFPTGMCVCVCVCTSVVCVCVCVCVCVTPWALSHHMGQWSPDQQGAVAAG